MDTSAFRGLWTALVTPFREGNGIDNPIDFDALDTLLDMQIAGWVDGIHFLGTTGENPTLTDAEGETIVYHGIEKLVWRTKVMVNIGTYSTLASLENMKRYESIDGIDAYLLVNPYYNKPTQTGLFLHFTTLAKATTRPVLIYNIKGRCAVNLENATLLAMIDACPNIIWVKEASGDLMQIRELIEKRPPGFLVLSGDDSITSEVIRFWGDGVVSVASNAIPHKMTQYVSACLRRDPESDTIGTQLRPFFENLFLQSNPLPLKTYLAEKWVIRETFRLPMCPMDQGPREQFLEFIRTFES